MGFRLGKGHLWRTWPWRCLQCKQQGCWVADPRNTPVRGGKSQTLSRNPWDQQKGVLADQLIRESAFLGENLYSALIVHIFVEPWWPILSEHMLWKYTLYPASLTSNLAMTRWPSLQFSRWYALHFEFQVSSKFRGDRWLCACWHAKDRHLTYLSWTEPILTEICKQSHSLLLRTLLTLKSDKKNLQIQVWKCLK